MGSGRMCCCGRSGCREKLVKERTPLLKRLTPSTTMALFQRVAMMMCEKDRGRNRAIHDIGK